MRRRSDFVWVEGLAALPEAARALFADPAAGGQGVAAIYDSQDWYRLLIETARPEGAAALFGVGRIDGRPALVAPVWRLADGKLTSLASPYTCAHRLLLAPGLTEADLMALGRALARALRREDGLRLEALPENWPPLSALLRGVRRGAIVPLGFAHFGNWRELLPEDGWTGYLAGRSGQLRETIRRRAARIRRDPAFRFEMIEGGQRLEPGIAAFAAVYAQSWKSAEPFPDFNADFMRDAARRGQLRLAVLWHGAAPVAVQYWLLADGEAQVLKLAQNAGFDAYSPGTVLTAWAVERMIGQDGIAALDFGRGDDGYKKLWAAERGQRVGVLLANPRCVNGSVMILRHVAGWLRRRGRLQQPRSSGDSA
jgi:hypothetical protein